MKDTFRNRLRGCIFPLHETKQDMNPLAWQPSIVQRERSLSVMSIRNQLKHLEQESQPDNWKII